MSWTTAETFPRCRRLAAATTTSAARAAASLRPAASALGGARTTLRRVCLIALALAPRPELALVVIANRDEHYARPTAPMHAWDATPSSIVAGVDLERGGTWMGVRSVAGVARFAAVTNVRDPADLRPKDPGEPSRGDVVRDYLASDRPALAYASSVAADRAMRGFNLLALDEDGLVWASNRGGALPRRIVRGVHGLSNAALDTPWPKVERAKTLLAAELARRAEPDVEALFGILADDARPSDETLPDTGVGLALERHLSPIRIAMPTYGTRSATVLIARADGSGTIVERTLAPSPGADVRIPLPAFRLSPRVLAR